MAGRALAATLGVLVAASCSAPRNALTLPEDLIAIDAVRTEHVRGVNGTDAELVLRGMAPGLVYLGPGMNPVVGAAALRKTIEPLYRQIRPKIA